MVLHFHDTGDVAHQAYLTRCLQALGVGLGIEAHIQAMPYCMGTLFWQLNDAWPGISWSAIDYRLRPKILFSALERYYFPILLSFRKENREGEICWSNSGPDTLWGRLSASVLSFSGDTLWSLSRRVVARPLASECASWPEMNQSILLQEASNGFVYLEWQGVKGETTRGVYWFGEPAQFQSSKPAWDLYWEKDVLFLKARSLIVFPEVEGAEIISSPFASATAWIPGDVIALQPQPGCPVFLRTLSGLYELVTTHSNHRNERN